MADSHSIALLSGHCTCGRNEYTITLPKPLPSIGAPLVIFDSSADSRRAHSTPLGGSYLRIPLSNISSTTIAFFPDESHASIRRVFSARDRPLVKRHFCGFCGTPLTLWTEETRQEAEFVRVCLGSLESESWEILNTLGLLPGLNPGDLDEGNVDETTVKEPETVIQSLRTTEDVDMEERDPDPGVRGTVVHSFRSGGDRGGRSWFEEIIAGSELGRIRQSEGEFTSGGTTKVEWEVVEFEHLLDGDGQDELSGNLQNEASSSGKRKIDQLID